MIESTKRAFTLIELIVVMAIIITLSVIGFISYNSYVMDSRNAAREAELNDIVKAIDQFIFANGVPPKCNTSTNAYCYFANHTGIVTSKEKGTTGGWAPGSGSYGPAGEGILPADWAKLNLKKSPEDPRNVYFLYAYNGTKYVVLATKELADGYAAMIKGPQVMEELTADAGAVPPATCTLPCKPNSGAPATWGVTTDTNVVASAAGLGIQLDGETVQAGVIQVANPLAIKYNNFTSLKTYPAPAWNAAVPYSW